MATSFCKGDLEKWADVQLGRRNGHGVSLPRVHAQCGPHESSVQGTIQARILERMHVYVCLSPFTAHLK